MLAGKRSRRLRPCGVGGQWCGACCWVPGPPGPLSGVVFRSRRPGPVLCGVGVWGGVVWWFENWRVDASMNGVPLWGVPGVFVLLILSNRSVPACRVGAWIVFASVLVSRPHCWCGWCLDDLISCRRVFQCRWHGPVAPLFCGVGGFVAMGVWWMPWQAVPMKDVWGRDRPRGAADRALIRGCPNGVTRRLLWAGTAEFCAGGTQGSETSQYLQERILRE